MQYISILAGLYKQPIADLVAKLHTLPATEAGSSQPRNPEVSYSIVCTVLLVLMFESYVSRLRHFSPVKKRSVLDQLKDVKGFKRLHRQLVEVYCVRDAIAHNHVYEYTQKWKDATVKDVNFTIDQTYQAYDKKYKGVVCLRKRLPPVTKILRLDADPSRLGRDGLRTVFHVIFSCLDKLKKLGAMDVDVHHLNVRYAPAKGRVGVSALSFPFWKLRDEF